MEGAVEGDRPRSEGAATAPRGLLEREQEISALAGVVERAARGTGAVVAIEGGSGIGKSSLLATAGELAESRGMDTYLARASETERAFGYELVRDLAGGLLRSMDAAHPGEAPPEGSLELSALLDPARETPPRELVVARGLVRRLAGTAAERPLLVGIDDIHWADPASLRVLLYLARRITDLAAVLCLTTRPASGGDPASPLVDALVVEAAGRVLTPGPLSPAASAVLVSRRLGDTADPAFCAACHEATGGNPLLLRELVRALASEGIEPTASQIEAIARIGGPAVSRTVRLRLAHLPEDATRLAQAAAVLGDGTPIAQAARLARLDPETAFDAAAGLGQLELLAGGSRVAFVHPLVREAVLAALTPAEAASLHEAAAGLLAGSGASPQRVAGHLLHSPPKGSADTARALRKAGNAATADGNPQAAVELLARALEEPVPDSDRAGILLELATAERPINADSARTHAGMALDLIEEPEDRARAALQLAELLPATDPRGAIAVMEPYLDRLRDTETRLRARSAMLTAALLAPDRLFLARELAEALRPEAGTGSPAARGAASLIGYLDALQNARPASAIAEQTETAIAAPLDDPHILGQLIIGMIALVGADSPVALSVADRWKALADETGFASLATAALMCRSHALLARGRLGEALADAREGLEVAELYVGGAPVSWTASALVEALIETGELEQAGRLASRLAPRSTPEWTCDLHGLLGCRARLAALEGDPASALERTLELGRMCEGAGIRNPALAPWRARAAVLLARSDDGVERARALAAEEVELARAWGAPRALGRALTALALVDDPAEAIALHREAVDVLDGSPARLELAKASLELGTALRRLGKHAAARESLRRSAELAEECGAGPLAARVRDELVAAGARPRRAAVSGPGSLTPQEQRVATIAVEGLSNREIAERLYLAPSTVESHLSSIYRKLGISSRSQLQRALG